MQSSVQTQAASGTFTFPCDFGHRVPLRALRSPGLRENALRCHAWLSYATLLQPTIIMWNQQKRSRQKNSDTRALQAFSQNVPWHEGPQQDGCLLQVVLLCTAPAENTTRSLTCQGSEAMPRGHKRLQPDPGPLQGGVVRLGWEGQRFPKSTYVHEAWKCRKRIASPKLLVCGPEV